MESAPSPRFMPDAGPSVETLVRPNGADGGLPDAPFIVDQVLSYEPRVAAKRRVKCSSVARWAGIAVTGYSSLVMFGWIFGIDLLTRPLLGESTMRVNTAISLALLGGAITLLAYSTETVIARIPTAQTEAESLKFRDRAAAAMALAAATIGLLTAIEYIFSFDLGIDELVADETADYASMAYPGRPSELTSSLLIAAGAALALTAWHRRRTTVLIQLLAVTTMLFALIAILGHTYSADIVFEVKSRSSTALSTAVGLFLVGLGTLCLRPYDGWMRIISGAGAGSDMVRRLVPAIVLGIPLLGFVRMLGEDAGLYDGRYGTALMATVIVTIFTAIVLSVGVQLNRQEDRRILAEARRHRLQTLLDGLVENSRSVIVIQDPEGRFLLVNNAFERWSRISREEVVGRTTFDLFSRDYAEQLEVMRVKVVKDRVALTEEITAETNADARTFIAQIFPIVDDSDKLIGTGALATDITDRKKNEQITQQLNAELEREAERTHEAVKELESFAHTVSHDLRSPLRAIDGFSQIVESDYDDQLDERGKHFLHSIRAGVKEMGELIDGLLEFSRLGRAELNLTELDMHEVAVHANEQLEYDRENRVVHVRIDDLPAANADRRLIGAVFANLLSNAHKYTRKRNVAEIQVGSVDVERGHVPTYFVRDNGVGFEMRYADKLFGVFERLHRSEDYEGSGVGLATVQRIVRRHGGCIWAQSEPDIGTTIFFQLERNGDTDD